MSALSNRVQSHMEKPLGSSGLRHLARDDDQQPRGRSRSSEGLVRGLTSSLIRISGDRIDSIDGSQACEMDLVTSCR
jgi:hypothetical protein